MSEQFRVLFQNKIIKAHERVRKDGYIEVRARIDGKDFTGTGKDGKTAAERFIAALNRETEAEVQKDITFGEYARIWLETVKKPKVKENTYYVYNRSFNTDILPVFGNRKVKDIRQFEIQRYLDGIVDSGRENTAVTVYIHLKALFDYAVIDGIIPLSPMAKISAPSHRQVHGSILSKDEEKLLWDGARQNNKLTKHARAYLFILYTGLRRSELASAEIIGNEWIKVECAKGRKGQTKYREIPITPMLRRALPIIGDIAEIKKLSTSALSNRIHELLPSRHTHELRHTFITRCQECGVRREYVSLWAGHVADSSITATVYTHFEQNKELQLKEAEKVDY